MMTQFVGAYNDKKGESESQRLKPDGTKPLPEPMSTYHQ